MSRIARALALLLVLLPAGSGAQTVIVLSWDGLRHDLAGAPEAPALARMAREGARAERLVPPFPSNTFPAHVSLATGAHPDRHGVVGNTFVDRQRGAARYPSDPSWIEAEPLWVAAERQGRRAATFFWVGSEKAWRGRAASYRMAPFDTRVSERRKVEQILAWLDLPPAERPQLVMAWWHGVDHVAHRLGPDDDRVRRQLAEQDAELARLLSGLDARALWGTTTVLVVSDHGMAAARRWLDPERALERAGVPARVLREGGMAHVYLERSADLRRAASALAALEATRVWPREELPERLRLRHAHRTGDLVLLTEPPYVFYRRPTWWRRAALALLSRSIGAHGYDPRHPDMAGVFLALGRGAPPGARLPAVHAVDVAPTVAALLGIEPPAHSEGVVRLPPAP